jgi:hypothetical protein
MLGCFKFGRWCAEHTMELGLPGVISEIPASTYLLATYRARRKYWETEGLTFDQATQAAYFELHGMATGLAGDREPVNGPARVAALPPCMTSSYSSRSRPARR